jgi:hypothetical protein
MSMSPEALAKIERIALKTIAGWSEDERAEWDERAATLEYERSDTCANRQEANVLAFWQLNATRKAAHR